MAACWRPNALRRRDFFALRREQYRQRRNSPEIEPIPTGEAVEVEVEIEFAPGAGAP